MPGAPIDPALFPLREDAVHPPHRGGLLSLHEKFYSATGRWRIIKKSAPK